MILTEASEYHSFCQSFWELSPFHIFKNREIAFTVKVEKIFFSKSSKGPIVIKEIDKSIEKNTFDLKNLIKLIHDLLGISKESKERSIFTKPKVFKSFRKDKVDWSWQL